VLPSQRVDRLDTIAARLAVMDLALRSPAAAVMIVQLVTLSFP
jgi:hypothetical protein